MDRCTWKRCRKDAVLIWLERPLCAKHWDEVCRRREAQAPDTIKRQHTKPPRNPRATGPAQTLRPEQQEQEWTGLSLPRMDLNARDNTGRDQTGLDKTR